MLLNGYPLYQLPVAAVTYYHEGSRRDWVTKHSTQQLPTL